MKHIVAIIISFGVIGCAGLVFAHTENVLPSPGLTPSSPFYFLDRWGESVQNFFAFGAEAKARLRVRLAAERIAEVKVMLEVRGKNAPGIDVALSRLNSHLEEAAIIFSEEKDKGRNIESLIQEVYAGFEEKINLLDRDFRIEKGLEKMEESLEILETGATKEIPEVLPLKPAIMPTMHPPIPTIQNFTVEADDAGLYPREIRAKKGALVNLTFKVHSEGVYFGGLDFRGGKYFSTGAIAPGKGKTIQFTADQSFSYSSYWPASGNLKATGQIIVE